MFGWGYGVGTDHYGGYAEAASVLSRCLVKLPPGMKSAFDAARIGTAGYTAMLCVDALHRNGLKTGTGPVLVTGIRLFSFIFPSSLRMAEFVKVRLEAWAPSPPSSCPSSATKSSP